MRKYLFLAITLLAQAGIAQTLKEGKLANVTQLTQDGAKYENPRWSPDGNKIAFTEYGYNGLLVMDANGGNKTQVSNDKNVGFMYEWSADSKEILVRDLRYVGSKRLQAAWSIDLNGKKTRMTEDVARMDPASWRYNANGTKSIISRDAKVIASPVKLTIKSTTALKLSQTANTSVMVNKDGLSVINAIGAQTIINAEPSFCPALSPNGKKVAFAQRDGIYVINIDGTGKQKLSRGFNPTWANDTQIIFEKSTDDGHNYTSSDLYMINANGSSLRALTSTTDRMEMCPAVSSDGSKIVFTSFSDGQIYTADLK